MNDLGIRLVWSAVQVTLLALAATALYAMAKRRGPVARASLLAMALAVNLVLTLLALCPLPTWWTWQSMPAAPVLAVSRPGTTTSPSADDPPAVAAAPAGPAAPGGGLATSFDPLRQLWEQIGATTASSPERRRHWAGLVAALFLTGAAFGAVRLVLGAWSVHHCRRRSRPVEDSALTGLAEALRQEMGCPSPVELRACDDLNGPATAGWLRPVILLPADWPAWGEAERRAALAHELAHVCRADSLARLAAGASAALHFYHPLVSWLAGRLELQQELAADDLAARFAGGRPTYLVALARLALRQEGRQPGWPARALLSSPETLMRRIATLRTNDCSPQASPPSGGRAVLVTLLAAVAVSVSALRSPAQRAEGVTGAAKEALVQGVESRTGRLLAGFGVNGDGGLTGNVVLGGAVNQDSAAVNMPYLSSDHAGVWGFRPAAVFGRAEVKTMIGPLNGNAKLQGLLKACGLEADLAKVLGSIEQVRGRVSLRTDKKAKEPQSSAVMDLTMVRLTHAFDWKKFLNPILPGAVAVNYAGKVYYRAPKGALGKGSLKEVAAILGPVPEPFEVCYHILDDRTVVFDLEKFLRPWLKGKDGVNLPGLVEDWKRVERGLYALAFVNRDLHWMDDRKQPDGALSPAVVAVFRNSTSLALGVNYYADDFSVQLLTRSKTKGAAAEVARGLHELVKEVDERREEEPRKPTGGAAVGYRVLKELLEQARIDRRGKEVRWHTAVKVSFGDLIEAVSSGGLGL